MTRHTSIRYSSSCHTHVNMGASIFFTAAMIRGFRSARSSMRVLCVIRTKCTLHNNHRLTVLYSNQKTSSPPGAAIFSLHTLASSSGRNVNYDEKQHTGGKILSCSFYLYILRKYVSYGFPIIIFCKPGVHYETPCINLSATCLSLVLLHRLLAVALAAGLPTKRQVRHH